MIRRIALHVVFWVVYLAINIYVEVFLINYSYFQLDMGTRIMKALIPELLLLPAKLLMAYTIMYWILPRLNSIARWKNVFVLIMVTVVSLGWYHLMLTRVIYPIVNHEVFPESTFMENITRSIYRLLDLLTIVGIACTFKLLRQQTKDAKKKQELIREKLQSELNFIRSQTNPHFLFNTLNSIYALARKQSPQTSEVVMQLSKLLRYMIHECKEPFVPLEKEWKIIEDYVNLEKLRYGNRVQVQMNNQIIPNGEMIAPLLLLPLVENAFKHGAGNNRDHTEILINLDQKNDELHFKVENNVGDNRNEKGGGGIGLKNVKRQLELLYPHHSFNIDNQNGKFTVNLSFKSLC
jgi:two-component system, LytTR family, sensor kinase